MNIIKKNNIPSVSKDFGTKTDYYIFSDHEIHFNEIDPKTSQPWHHHKRVSEELFVINGFLTIYWLDTDKKVNKRVVTNGTLVQVEKSVHKISNDTNQPVTFLVLKYISENQDLRDQIKKDKILDKINV